MELKRPGAMIHYEVWRGAEAAPGDGERKPPLRPDLGEGGPVVVLVNGHTRPLNDFRLFGRYLTERGFQVAALDNRGAGQTTVERAFTYDELVGDVLALMDAVGADAACLAGISMGGFISAGVALAAPERVEKLALISTAASQTMIAVDERPWTTDAAEVSAKMAPYFTAEFAQRNEMLVKSMVKQIAKNVATGRFAENSELQRQALKGFDARPRLSGIRCPVLVVHGAEDRIIPPAAARELAGLIPGAKLAELPAAGHLLLAEKPKELYGLVGGFFGGLS